MSFTTDVNPFTAGLPLPLALPLPLGQIELDDTVRPEIVGRAAAADTPISEGGRQDGSPSLGTPMEESFLPTKKFVSTPYPEKKGWLEDDEEEDEEADSQKGAKYVASDEDSEGEEEDDYFESEKQSIEQATEALTLNTL